MFFASRIFQFLKNLGPPKFTSTFPEYIEVFANSTTPKDYYMNLPPISDPDNDQWEIIENFNEAVIFSSKKSITDKNGMLVNNKLLFSPTS